MENNVEEFVSDLVETTYSHGFKWRINNISVASPKKDFIIKSKEFYFYDANAKWFVKISQFIYDTNDRFLGVTFVLRDEGKDENARYKFSVGLESGAVLESQFMSKNKTSKSALMEYQMGQFIPVPNGVETIVLEPKVIFETLTMDTKPRYRPESVVEVNTVVANAEVANGTGAFVFAGPMPRKAFAGEAMPGPLQPMPSNRRELMIGHAMPGPGEPMPQVVMPGKALPRKALAGEAISSPFFEEHDYDTLVDLSGIVIPEILVTKEDEGKAEISFSTDSEFKSSAKLSSDTESSDSESEDSDDDFSDDEVFEIVEDNKPRPGCKMSNLELTKAIRKIYMQKMKQIADTSSRLLVTAARVS